MKGEVEKQFCTPVISPTGSTTSKPLAFLPPLTIACSVPHGTTFSYKMGALLPIHVVHTTLAKHRRPAPKWCIWISRWQQDDLRVRFIQTLWDGGRQDSVSLVLAASLRDSAPGFFWQSDACRPALWVDALLIERTLFERSELGRPPKAGVRPIW